MENRNTITLTFEDGSEKEFIILFTHQAECDGKNYVFILDDNDEEAGVGVLEYIEKGDGQGDILPVNDDNEAFLKYLVYQKNFQIHLIWLSYDCYPHAL